MQRFARRFFLVGFTHRLPRRRPGWARLIFRVAVPASDDLNTNVVPFLCRFARAATGVGARPTANTLFVSPRPVTSGLVTSGSTTGIGNSYAPMSTAPPCLRAAPSRSWEPFSGSPRRR